MIISIVNEIVTDMSLPFYHGTTQFQNLIADEQTLPAIYLDQPITANYNLSQSGYTSATYPINVLFLFKSELDWTPEQHDTNCIQLAEAKIREFINRCEANPAFDLITNISSTEFINLFDCNVSGKTLSLTLQVNNQYSVCADASIDLTRGTVVNSDGSYNNVVGMGNTLELADISVTDSDGSVSTLPAMTDVICTAGVFPSGIAYQRPQITGATTSYRTGDDAWHLANGTYDYTPPTNPIYLAELDTTALEPFKTLKNQNTFGNLERFTDDLGTQIYANNYVIDHLTGLGYYNSSPLTDIWDNCIDNANASTLLGFSDWRMTNINEVLSFLEFEGGNYNQLPYNYTGNVIWTSTARYDVFASTYKQLVYPPYGILNPGLITQNRDLRICRNHF
jgi:hypothetical protein